MNWEIGRFRDSGGGFEKVELLLHRKKMDLNYPRYFLYCGQARGYMKLGDARFNEAEQRIETRRAIRVPVSKRNQFSRVFGMTAVKL